MKLILALILAEKKEKRKKKKKLILAQAVRDVGRRSGRQRRLGGQGRVPHARSSRDAWNGAYGGAAPATKLAAIMGFVFSMP